MNWGHLGSAVKYSHSSLTVRTVFAIVFVGILRSVKCWAGVRRKKKRNLWLVSESSGWCSVPWAPQHCCCQTPGALASSSRAYRSNTQAQDCQNPSCQGEKSTLSGCDTVYWWKRKTKNDFALTFWTNVFSQQLLVTYLHLSMFRNVSYLLTIPLLKNAESFRRLVTKQLISYLRVPPAVGEARSVCVFSKSKSKNKNMETNQESSI